MPPPKTVPTFRLRPPRPPRVLLPRLRVTGSLLATDPGGLAVVAAAPGYGSTTAVHQALGGSADEVCWVTLDESISDDDARVLVQASVGAESDDTSGMVSALHGKYSTWLVIDGLSPSLHIGLTQVLRELATRMPASARVIVTSHESFTPDGAIVFDEELLAFAPDDAFDVVSALVPGADVDEVADIIATAHGWVSALVAGAQRLASYGAASEWLRDQGPAELLSAWFDGLLPADRELLQRTAVLDVLGEGPVVSIMGSEASFQRLDDLVRSHAYIWPCEAPKGHSGRWWNRHPMLSTFLRQRAGVASKAGHDAAASWFAQCGDVQSAISHMIAAGRLRDAANLLREHESALLSSGEAPQVLQWYSEIATVQEDRIEALLRNAWGHAMARDIAGADSAAARLRDEMATAQAAIDEERTQKWASDEALLRAYLAAYHGDPSTVISAARRAMETSVAEPARDAVQLAPVLLARGLLWSGQTQAAIDMCDSLAGLPYPNDVLRELHLAGMRANVLCATGDIRQAAEIVLGIDTWVAAGGVDPLSIQAFAPGLAHAWVALESGDITTATTVAAEISDAAEAIGHLSDAAWACLLAAQAETARGDLGAAMRVLARGRSLALYHIPDSTLGVPLDQVQAQIHICAGDTVRADRLIRRLPPSDARALLSARAGLARQPVLSRRTLEAISAKTPRWSAERHMLLAALLSSGSRRMAQGHLREAAAIAAQHGMRQLLVAAPVAAVDLAAETALEFADPHLEWLLQPMRLDEVARGEPAPAAVNLSRGELQLLGILPSRAKNVEIANQLGVSVNTVKTRLRRLYAKLGAANRDEAIERARERGLLH